MNNVQTNIMNIAPAPSTAMKANAVEAVRPVKQAGATADRGAKKPSFDKTLAKLKASKQDAAETPEVMAKDPLAATLAASQQKQTDKAASVGSKEASETGKAVAEAGARGEALEAVQASAENSPAQPVSEGNAPASSAAAASFDVRQSESDGTVVEQAADVQAAWTTSSQKRGAESAPAAIVPTDSVASLVEEAFSTEEAAPSAADLRGDHGAAHQKDAQRLDNLAALLPQSEKPATQDLLQTLSGRNLPQPMQAAAAGETLAAAHVAESSPEEPLPLEETTAPLQPQTNPLTSEAEKAVLPDALLRALTQQPATPAAAAEATPQTQAAQQPVGETNAAAFDAALLPQEPTDASTGQDMADEASDDGLTGLLNRQQMAQEQKAQREALPQAEPMRSSSEGAARTKTAFAVQSFGEVMHPQESSSQATQANPAVSFQTTLQEAAPAQPMAPASPQKDYEVAKQIVEQARLLRLPEETQMVIRLKPEHLGELTLKVSVAASGTVNAAFHTDNAAVRTIIETSMIQLKHELQAQGLKVDNVGVYAGLGDSSLMSQQDANAHYAQHGGQGSSQGRDAQQALASFEEEQQSLAANAQQGVLAQDGVDYRI